jgi:uncharacterized integral membrane protein
MQKAKLISAITAILLVIVITLQNTQPVDAKLLFITITAPTAALIGFSLVIGVVAGMLIAMSLSSKKGKKN